MTDQDSPETQARLSHEGRARRDAMLDELIDTMHQVRRSRRRRRYAAVCVLLLVTAGVAGQAIFSGSSSREDLQADNGVTEKPEMDQMAESHELIRYSRVSTDSSVVDRYRATSSNAARHIERVSDEEFLDALSSAGYQVGLIEVGDEVRLSQPVPANPIVPAPSDSRDPAGNSDAALG